MTSQQIENDDDDEPDYVEPEDPDAEPTDICTHTDYADPDQFDEGVDA